MNDIQIDISHLRWFTKLFPPGDPGCICSACGKKIISTDIPIRLICGPCNKHLCFHHKCYCDFFLISPLVT